jgi:hypothetical protein
MPEKQVSYCENKPSNTNHMTLSDEQSFVQLYNYDENSYFPEKKSFTLGSDRDNL